MTIIGEVQNKIRHESLTIVTLSSLADLVFQGFLGIKLLTFLQFKVFEQLFELQLTEVTLYLYLTRQSTCQTISRFANLCTLLHVNLNGLIQTSEGFRLLLLSLVECLLHILQALLQRVDDLRDLFLILFAKFLLTLFEHLLRSGLHLFFDEFELTLHLLLVHLLQSSNLYVESCLLFVQLFFVGGLLCFQLSYKVLYVRLLDVTLRRQFNNVINQALLTTVADKIAENRHHKDGHDGYNQVYFHNSIFTSGKGKK